LGYDNLEFITSMQICQLAWTCWNFPLKFPWFSVHKHYNMWKGFSIQKYNSIIITINVKIRNLKNVSCSVFKGSTTRFELILMEVVSLWKFSTKFKFFVFHLEKYLPIQTYMKRAMCWYVAVLKIIIVNSNSCIKIRKIESLT
jgi:hypothetical protein